MQTRKLLMYISYLGTNYQGIQLQNRRKIPPRKEIKQITSTLPELTTIQGVLEQALRKVLQLKEVILFNSSRTDTGVHALSSTVQFIVDAEAFSVFPFSPERICRHLNLYLEKSETDIRIQRVVEVPEDFNCRRAFSRTYKFRIAVAKQNDFDNCFSLLRLDATLPIIELHQAQIVAQPFDQEVVQQACRAFIGTWNFRSFASLHGKSLYSGRPITEKDLIKTIFKFSFSKTKIESEDELEGAQNYYSWDSSYNKLDFYDFNIEGSGFVRRQVRRMVGLLIGIGQGYFDSKEIVRMLNNPSADAWPPNAIAASANGLFLKSVNYKNIQVLRGPLS